MPEGPGRKDVLLVEDDFDIRETLRQVLELEGYGVVDASNGREALDRLGQGMQPGVIVLDLMMPVMNGWEFLEARAENGIWSGIPVIVVSAVNDPSVLSRASHAIKKPIEIDPFLKLIEKYCME